MFLRYFHDQLVWSPYYAELDALNLGDLIGGLDGEAGGCGASA